MRHKLKFETILGGVALHPEGVDRNFLLIQQIVFWHESPSTRRAWIEIVWKQGIRLRFRVALHPEGVDRNFITVLIE